MANVLQVMIASLLFITVFGGLVITHTDFAETYEFENNEDYFGEGSGNAEDVDLAYNLSREISSKFREDASDESNLDTSVVGGLNAIRLGLDIVDVVKKTLNFIALRLQIPAWIVNASLFVVIMGTTLAIIAAFLGRRTSD